MASRWGVGVVPVQMELYGGCTWVVAIYFEEGGEWTRDEATALARQLATALRETSRVETFGFRMEGGDAE